MRWEQLPAGSLNQRWMIIANPIEGSSSDASDDQRSSETQYGNRLCIWCFSKSVTQQIYHHVFLWRYDWHHVGSKAWTYSWTDHGWKWPNSTDSSSIKGVVQIYSQPFLWYDLYDSVLKKMGFVINSVEPCITNAVLNGKQCTVAWYLVRGWLDDLTRRLWYSHHGIDRNSAAFGKMPITRGKDQFLGIKISFLDDGMAELDMSSYLRNAIAASGLKIHRHAKKAAKKDLHSVDDGLPWLTKEESERFVTSTYMLMHAALRVWGDLCPTLNF